MAGRLAAILKWLSDPDNRPSYLCSTLAQLAVISVLSFIVAAFYVMVKVAHGMDAKTARDILEPFVWIATTFGASYLATRKVGNGGQPPPTSGAVAGG